MILAQRYRDGEVWFSYERFDSPDDLFWNPSSTAQVRFKSFTANPPAPQAVCEDRIEWQAKGLCALARRRVC